MSVFLYVIVERDPTYELLYTPPPRDAVIVTLFTAVSFILPAASDFFKQLQQQGKLVPPGSNDLPVAAVGL